MTQVTLNVVCAVFALFMSWLYLHLGLTEIFDNYLHKLFFAKSVLEYTLLDLELVHLLMRFIKWLYRKLEQLETTSFDDNELVLGAFLSIVNKIHFVLINEFLHEFFYVCFCCYVHNLSYVCWKLVPCIYNGYEMLFTNEKVIWAMLPETMEVLFQINRISDLFLHHVNCCKGFFQVQLTFIKVKLEQLWWLIEILWEL